MKGGKDRHEVVEVNNGNGSMKKAYKDLLMERISIGNSRVQRGPLAEGGGSGSSIEDTAEGTTNRYNIGMIEETGESINDYDDFKKNILNNESISDGNDEDYEDDDWLNYSDNDDDDDDVDDDDDEGNSLQEANESFIEDYDEIDDYTSTDMENISTEDTDYEYEDEYDTMLHDKSVRYNEDITTSNSNKFLRNISLGITMMFILLLTIPLILNGKTDSSISEFSTIKPTSLGNIQKQVNHLYKEMNTRNDQYQSDLDKTIKVVISQFEKNIKKLIPSNILDFQAQLELLNTKVNSLSSSLTNWDTMNKDYRSKFSMENITEWHDKLIEELNHRLPNEIPVVVNGTSSMLVIPELHEYISGLLSDLIQHVEPTDLKSELKYDLNEYIKEVLENQLQYVDKDYFITELNRNLQLNKHEIWQEVSTKLEQIENENAKYKSSINISPDQYSTILLKKMVNKIYNANQHQWEDDLDFGSLSMGTRLLNHLTSSTWKYGYGTSPIELLSTTRGSSTYWQCDSTNDCSWAIRFQQPLHLFRISYVHGRLTNNVHMMNSAPKVISVYVKLADDRSSISKFLDTAKLFKQGQLFAKDSTYIKIGQYNYNLAETEIRQQFPLPPWFIKLRPLVHSIVFQVDENYGNREFTSLKKFVVKAITQSDLEITSAGEFPFKAGDIPDYSSPSYLDDFERLHLKTPRRNNDGDDPDQEPKFDDSDNIPSFGQDELDI
ncbi:hypothetical protein Kpol_1060p46 [Vanderwaltozyma polyspora DSM 70294]|uniref:SUN domain-containing protein n=1 Tax=Vanderwaltozyma polyspora (strain ATCC 22028 / DSM 70294 / BCRC 21397 / CBS 2163 / NBRC 10782 / NRRL Y-8283 / UCD 57-17) TaxID=436907 RepID=A7TK44_VANPO|nr:uncharacterized protein Kpol_1060p46 [Vanderwaltozyma polyspora DSM 70294]EDO17390.1 hypothetical protein Kpol_1060p46 [Vanderwaltozyma polyspora DSM 70294]